MEALYPQKTHQRSRSRKKKATETIESIVLGRAPVGIVTTESGVMDSDTSVKDINDDDDDDDEVVQRGSGADDGLVVAATAASTTIENNDICFSGHEIKQIGVTATVVKRIPMAICSLDQSTKQPADTSNPPSTTHPPEAVPPKSTTSPTNGKISTLCPLSSAFTASEPNIAIRSRSSSAEITGADKVVSQPTRLDSCNSENTFRDSSFCHSHFRTARSRKSSAELDDIDNLPSSRPISLGSFAVRTHNRNKGSKSWIPFSLEDLDEASDKMDPRNQNHGARPPARFLPPSATTSNHPLRNVTTIDPGPNVFGFNGTSPQRAPQWSQVIRPQPHPGHMEMFGYYQHNLSANIPRQNPRPATVLPRTSIATPGTGLRMMVPDDISPTKHEEKQALRALQYNMMAQSYFQTGHYPPGSTCNPISQGQNICPTSSGTGAGYYEGAAGPKSSYGQTTGQIDQNYSLQHPPMIRENGNAHYSGYGPGQFQPSWIPGMFSETGISCTAPETFKDTENIKDASASLPTKSPVSLNAPASHQTNVNTSPQLLDSDQRSQAKLHDIAKYLKNVITTSQTASESNPDQDFQIEVKDRVGKVHPIPLPANPLKTYHKTLQQDPSPTKSAGTSQVQRTPKDGQTQGSLPDSSRTSTSMPLTHTSFNGPTKVSPVFASAFASRPGSDEIISKPPNSPQSRFKFRFPPPGLPIPPNFQGGSADKAYFEQETPASRLVQSNIWFHTDTRGEDLFRQRITEIAREETGRQRAIKMPLRPGGQEGVAEAGTVLLGHVLANLQSYTLCDSNQAKGFANFGPAPKHCYEPTHGGRRSFLDLDPITDPWKFPPPRHPLSKDPLVAYGGGNKTEKEVEEGKGPNNSVQEDEKRGLLFN
ncbi:hypothetical protein GX50_05601 [[Emmonsia] crescens]|uniref:Uncharacterized protein n=1 Tax=[Emmonsia] crescens TaxID=73230 RepID=A0A2B7ZE28_9EURO|nr:hypothetical protein GX50_05601 [Emmonsia crescens]